MSFYLHFSADGFRPVSLGLNLWPNLLQDVSDAFFTEPIPATNFFVCHLFKGVCSLSEFSFFSSSEAMEQNVRRHFDFANDGLKLLSCRL